MINKYQCMLMLFATTAHAACTTTLDLFNRYPTLGKKIAHISLGSLPTPVMELKQAEKNLPIGSLYIKRDDLSGGIERGTQLLGSNKVRSLEFFLAEALEQGARSIITSGSAGSHQAVLTALYARKAGLQPYVLLYQQHPSETTRRNLLMHLHYHSHIIPYTKTPDTFATTLAATQQRAFQQDGVAPYSILASGSQFPGLVGFVNAGFELKKQIERKELPEPDFLYITCATMGSAAGIMVGLRAAGLKTRVVAVAVKTTGTNINELLNFTNYINQYLHEKDATFPLFAWKKSDITLTNDFLGSGYAVPSAEGQEAINFMQEHEDIPLDNTYTGKTFAALLNDARAGKLKNKNVLFWYTYPSQPCRQITDGIDYKKLPKEFHHYFE